MAAHGATDLDEYTAELIHSGSHGHISWWGETFGPFTTYDEAFEAGKKAAADAGATGFRILQPVYSPFDRVHELDVIAIYDPAELADDTMTVAEAEAHLRSLGVKILDVAIV